MTGQTFTNENEIIDAALQILESRIEYRTDQEAITSPQASCDYLKLRLAGKESEAFALLLLDNRHRVRSEEHTSELQSH